MQCVSYKQMCYQAVNTKVMGLLVLISVFISVRLYRDFFSSTPADLGHSFASCTGWGSCLAGSLQGQSRFPLVRPTSSPINGRAAEHPWVSPCCDAHEDGEGQGEHSLPGSSPSLLQFLLVEEANKSHMGRERARTLREDSPSPLVLFNGEGDATSG